MCFSYVTKINSSIAKYFACLFKGYIFLGSLILMTNLQQISKWLLMYKQKLKILEDIKFIDIRN
jgi:hypothetical protein